MFEVLDLFGDFAESICVTLRITARLFVANDGQSFTEGVCERG